MRTDKCCCNCQKKYIHIFVYVYSFTQPGTRRTQRLRLPSKRHATLPCTGSFYRLGLHATRHTRVLSRGRKKGGRVKKQWKVRLQQRSNSILNSYTIKILARASCGKAEERSEAQREPSADSEGKKKRFFFWVVLHVCTQVGEASGAYLPGG